MQDSQSEVVQPSPIEASQPTNNKVEVVKALFKEGVPTFDATGRIGLHGTSIENFVSMVKSGAITPDLDKTKSQGESHNDRFYITPHRDALQGTPLFDGIKDMSLDTVFQAAADYSRITAFYSYMQKAAPGILDNDWYTHFVLSPKTPEGASMMPTSPEGKFTYEKMLGKGRGLGMDETVLKKTIQEALQRRGIVLAVNLDAAKQYPLHNGDRVPGGEIYIEGQSLPFKKLIMGAEPMLSMDKEEILEGVE